MVSPAQHKDRRCCSNRARRFAPNIFWKMMESAFVLKTDLASNLSFAKHILRSPLKQRRRDFLAIRNNKNNVMSSPTSLRESHGKKILVVDDDRVIIKTLSMMLTGSGYSVLSASAPSEAVESVRKEKPDLILLDITFSPDADVDGESWDGFRLAEWIRRMDELSNIPVIIISGADPEKYRERTAAIGAIAFFQKPIDDDELLETIAKTLAERPSA